MAILGIDVSKDTLDLTLIDEQSRKHQLQIRNTATGFQKMKRWLTKQKVASLHVCMEATNVYWEASAKFCYQQGWAVSVVNPARIKGFANSQMRRNKTDREDSDIIAEFCQKMNPQLWHPPSPAQRQLRDWVRHRAALQKSLTQQTNRRHTIKDANIRASLDKVISILKKEIAQADAQIQVILQTYEELQTQYQLLLSIPGIGPATAVFLLAEMYDLAEYKNARAAAADAGLTPSHYESGSSVRRRPKLSKVGKSAVRAALYWPAITAMQHNPVIVAFVKRLEARGKPYKVIRGAVMRKLLHIAYGVLKNQTAFNPDFSSST